MAQDMATIETRDVDALAGGDKKEFVTFFIDNQMFGIPVLNVQDILMTTNIAAIPQAPPAVRGSINLRGRIVTVIDVRVRLGLGKLVESGDGPRNEPEDDQSGGPGNGKGNGDGNGGSAAPAKKGAVSHGMGVTVEQGHELYTLLVDKIGDVTALSSDAYENNPGTLDPVWREFALGIYRLEDRLMVILDIERLLDVKAS